MLLWCALLAAVPAAVVEGRVGEPGAGAAGAQVTLVQGKQRQIVRTRADGTFRFRPLLRPGEISVVAPAGWSLSGADVRTFVAPVGGDVIRFDFPARAHRSLRGRLLLGGAPLAEVGVAAGASSTRTDSAGAFVLDDLPAGPSQLRVDGFGVAAEVQIPAAPGEISLDVPFQVRDLGGLDLVPVPQAPALRPLSDWAAARPMLPRDAVHLEKLCALASLDAAFRLAILAHPSEVGRAASAAVHVQRFLTGPCLVPQDRVVFAVGEVASPGRLAIVLARQEKR